MKALIIGLLLLPLAAIAQDASSGVENMLKQMEKMKAGMTPEQRKQFEATGTEQKLRDSLTKLRESQQKREQDNRTAALRNATQGEQQILDAPTLAKPENRHRP